MPAFGAFRFRFGEGIAGVGALIAQDEHHPVTAHSAGAAGTAGLFEGLIFCQPGTGAVAKHGGKRTVVILLQLGDIAVIQLFLTALDETGVAQRHERLRRKFQ